MSDAMRVIVCGGRDYSDRARVFAKLDAFHAVTPIGTIITGGAPGADHLAEHWADLRGVQVLVFQADWSRGKKAGPERNARMLAGASPDWVIAFPGGRGTADMVRRAFKACVNVMTVPRE